MQVFWFTRYSLSNLFTWQASSNVSNISDKSTNSVQWFIKITITSLYLYFDAFRDLLSTKRNQCRKKWIKNYLLKDKLGKSVKNFFFFSIQPYGRWLSKLYLFLFQTEYLSYDSIIINIPLRSFPKIWIDCNRENSSCVYPPNLFFLEFIPNFHLSFLYPFKFGIHPVWDLPLSRFLYIFVCSNFLGILSSPIRITCPKHLNLIF